MYRKLPNPPKKQMDIDEFQKHLDKKIVYHSLVKADESSKKKFNVVINPHASLDKYEVWTWAWSPEQAITFAVNQLFKKQDMIIYHKGELAEAQEYYESQSRILKSLILKDFRRGLTNYVRVTKE